MVLLFALTLYLGKIGERNFSCHLSTGKASQQYKLYYHGNTLTEDGKG
jgi:hypothetical protein